MPLLMALAAATQRRCFAQYTASSAVGANLIETPEMTMVKST
jgi:hypothetical protein